MLTLKHSSGMIKEVPTGFSWTTLFFGFWVPVLRGWLGYAGITLVAAIFTFGLSWLVVPFLINKQYVKSLLEKGYAPATDVDASKIQSMGIFFNPSRSDKDQTGANAAAA